MAYLLLSHHDGIESLAANLVAESSEFTDGVANSLEKLSLVLHQVFGSCVAATFLIADQRQYHVSRQMHTFGFRF